MCYRCSRNVNLRAGVRPALIPEEHNSMREIKFRVWDPRYKEMVPPKGEGFTVGDFAMGLYPTKFCNEPSFRDDFVFRDDLVLMQYTGLKDKNGKEIYEGDIVGSGVLKFVVEFNDRGFWEPFIDPNDQVANFPSSYLKVLGNIYENPELL